jgi:LAO/AO transport system kinase
MSVSTPTTDSTLWIPPIVKTVATESKGIAELAAAIAKHVEHLHQSGDWAARDRARLGSEMETLLREALMDRFLENIQQQGYEEMIEKVLNRNISPSEAVSALLNGNLN